MSDTPQNPLLKSARRELVVAALIWLTALCWSVGYSYKYGYYLQPEELTFAFGFPSWIFYGVVLPWLLCTLISGWFAFFFMQDADLGDTDDAPQAGSDDTHA